MGLFKRSRQEPAAAPASGSSGGRPAQFGHAAFDPADVEDARRGHPVVGLEQFAQARGLRFLPQAVYGVFASTQPAWPNYTFNVCIGALPGRRLGLISHELLELEAHEGSVQEGGALYDVRVMTTRSASSFLGVEKAPPNEPFAANAAWVPTTSVHARTPETASLPRIVVKRTVMQGLMADPVLDQYGLPGYMMPGGRSFDDAFVRAIAQCLSPFLSQRHDPWIRLVVTHGSVALTVNGYRADSSDLDHLSTAVAGIAEALAGLQPVAAPVPFTTYGPLAGTAPWPQGMLRPHPLYVGQYAAEAQRLGMHNEDVTHLLAVAPRRALPGLPSGVLAGTFPGTAAPCRLVWTEQGGRMSGTVRGGAVFVAAPGATTQIGGDANQNTGVTTEVADGLAYCWMRTRSTGTLEADQLVAALGATLRANGLVAL
ncbi:MAG TPA: hypothetical protein DCR14_20480 [Acidimicrobiaceae bacterium]|nr:hypothetical protein [Acidimicrobiaceae bacterium]